MQKAHGITTKLTRGTMGVVKQVQQLHDHTEIPPVTSMKASYYIEEEICLFTFMVVRVEDVFLSILYSLRIVLDSANCMLHKDRSNGPLADMHNRLSIYKQRKD
jgi:hypothetical protein